MSVSVVPELILNSIRTENSNRMTSSHSDFARELVLQQQPIARMVQRLLGWPTANHEVDDIVQEVMVSAWTHRGRFRGDSALGTWVATIAINQVRRHRRRRQLWARLFGRSTDVAAIPQAEATADESSRSLRRAMSALAHRDREILVLHYLEEHGVDEIAALLRLSHNAAHARMSRARNRLRAILDQEQGDG